MIFLVGFNFFVSNSFLVQDFEEDLVKVKGVEIIVKKAIESEPQG